MEGLNYQADKFFDEPKPISKTDRNKTWAHPLLGQLFQDKSFSVQLI